MDLWRDKWVVVAGVFIVLGSAYLLLPKDSNLFGLFTLLILSFLSATVIPFPKEVAFPVLMAAGVGVLYILIVASVGAFLGSTVNYFLGVGGMKVAEKYVSRARIKKLSSYLTRWGWPGLFVLTAIPIPFPIDILMILAGAAKMDLSTYLPVVGIGQLIRNSIFLGLIILVTNPSGIIPWSVVIQVPV